MARFDTSFGCCFYFCCCSRTPSRHLASGKPKHDRPTGTGDVHRPSCTKGKRRSFSRMAKQTRDSMDLSPPSPQLHPSTHLQPPPHRQRAKTQRRSDTKTALAAGPVLRTAMGQQGMRNLGRSVAMRDGRSDSGAVVERAQNGGCHRGSIYICLKKCHPSIHPCSPSINGKVSYWSSN